MKVLGIRQVVAFVADPEAAGAWYARVFGLHPADVHRADGFVWIETADTEIGFHPADDARNGASGSPVVYWRVASVDEARAELLAAGCEPWRGPLRIDVDRRICQVRDPFGTVLGLDGP